MWPVSKKTNMSPVSSIFKMFCVLLEFLQPGRSTVTSCVHHVSLENPPVKDIIGKRRLGAATIHEINRKVVCVMFLENSTEQANMREHQGNTEGTQREH